MNCTEFQQAASLYVSNDVEGSIAESAAAHLRACGECARLAEGYADTIQSLGEFSMPAISDAVYAAIRRRVLAEITQPIKPTGPINRLTALLGPYSKPAFATAAALVVIVTASYFSITMSRTEPTADENFVAAAPSTPNAGRHAPGGIASMELERREPVKPVEKPISSRIRRVSPTRHALRHPRVRISEYLNEAKSAQVEQTQPQTAAEPMRLEMQTSDPNIRIIWFTAVAQKPDSNDHTKP